MQLPRGGDGCYTKIRSAYGKWAMYPFTLARYAVRRSSPTLKNHPRGLGTMRHNGASCGAVIAPYPYTHHILTEIKQPSPTVPNVSLPPTHPPPNISKQLTKFLESTTFRMHLVISSNPLLEVLTGPISRRPHLPVAPLLDLLTLIVSLAVTKVSYNQRSVKFGPREERQH